MTTTKHHKAIKIRIFPNREQSAMMNATFGGVRFVWNRMVENFNAYGTESYVKDLSEVHIKKDNEWLGGIAAAAIQQKRMDFYATVKQFFNKNRKKKLGRMRFKKRGHSDSFRIPSQSCGYHKAIRGRGVYCPKIGVIRAAIDRPIPPDAKYLSLTFSRDSVGDYYVSILVEVESEHLPKTGRDIGIDLGLSHIAVLSDGTKIENPKHFRKNQAKLAGAQRHLSRKTRGSNTYNKQRVKVAKIHRKVSRCRNDEHHKLSKWLVTNYDTICMETLNVSGMKKNRSLAKSVFDAGWSSLVNMIGYKTHWYGKELVRIDRFFPSSKTCSCCGQKAESMPLNVRSWTCSSCGTKHDRDINAAVNIKNEGLRQAHGIISEGYPEYIGGENVRPKETSVSRLISLKPTEDIKTP